MSRPLAVTLASVLIASVSLVFVMEVGAMLLTAAPAVRAQGQAGVAFSGARVHCVTVSAARAAAAAVIGVAFALIVAGLASYFTDQGRRIVTVMLILPLLSSAAPRLFVLRDVLGREGAVNRFLMWATGRTEPVEWLLFSEFGVVLGLVVNTLPFCALLALAALRASGDHIWQICAELRVGAWQQFRRVVVPTVFGAAVTGGLLAFAVAFGSSLETSFLGESRCSLPDAIVSLWRGEQFDAAALLGAAVALIQFTAFVATASAITVNSARLVKRGDRWASAYSV